MRRQVPHLRRMSFLLVEACPVTNSPLLPQDELRNGEEIARCPSCSLLLRVIYDPDEFEDEDEAEISLATLTV